MSSIRKNINAFDGLKVAAIHSGSFSKVVEEMYNRLLWINSTRLLNFL